MKLGETCECGGTFGGYEYPGGSKFRYDGISEVVCLSCNRRWGRWCEEELTSHEVEPPFCNGGPHPRIIDLNEESKV